MVAVTLEQQCAIDDDYGRPTDVHIFSDERSARSTLASWGYEDHEDYPGQRRVMIQRQYHSEVLAVIHNVTSHIRKSGT